MKNLLITITATLVCVNAFAQGTFQNLDFESANIPSGTQAGSMVPISSAMPGWSASFLTYDGTIQQQSQIMYDGGSLGSAFISINDTHGQAFGGSLGALQGSYSLCLAGGNSLFEGGLKSATIGQTGLVPYGAVSILMDVWTEHGFSVSLGDQTIITTAGSWSGEVSANISAFAGQTTQLSITSPYLPPPNAGQNPNPALIDDIRFVTIPEPNIFALSALGALLVGWRGLERQRCQRN